QGARGEFGRYIDQPAIRSRSIPVASQVSPRRTNGGAMGRTRHGCMDAIGRYGGVRREPGAIRRSDAGRRGVARSARRQAEGTPGGGGRPEEGDREDRKSTRLNSSHDQISYAVFCVNK